MSPLILGLVILLATLPFVNTLPNTFVFDDVSVIVENPQIKSLGNLPTLLKTGYSLQPGYRGNLPHKGVLYRPLVMISYALNYALGGLHPFGYHMVNLLAHLGVSLMVYRLFLRLFHHREGALLAGGLFAVHPLHTEAVTGIVGRAELFAAGFFLLAWWWYLDGRGRWRHAVASLGAFALALLSKEHAVTLPGILVLSDVFAAKGWEGQSRLGRSLGRQGPGLVQRYGGYLAVLIGYLLVRATVAVVRPPRSSLLDNPLTHVGPVPGLLTALEVAGRYLWLMVWPQSLSPDYSYNQIPVVTSPWAPGFLLALLAWGALIGVACWSFQGARRAFLCIGFTLVTFSIASNFLVPIGTIMGERLFYLPSAGLCLLAGVGWQRLLESRRGTTSFNLTRWVGAGLLGAVVVLLAFRTVVRNQDWRNEETLFRSAALVAPNSAKVRLNLGGVYLKNGLTEAAMQEFQASLAILPTPMVYRNLGILYLRSGRPEAAVAEYRKALALDPRDAEAYSNLGYVLLGQGLVEEAITALQQAIALNPHLPGAHYTLGRAWAERERWPQAIAAYQEARRLNPDFVEAAYAEGLALEASGQYQAAAQAFEEALRLKPGLGVAHRRLAELYRARLGDPEKAREHLRQANVGE